MGGNGAGIIALDIGWVCVSLHFEKCFERLGVPAGTMPPLEFLLSCESLERGLCSEDEWLDGFQSLFEGRFSKEELREAWNLIVGPSLPGMKEAAEELIRQGWRFAYLSDTSSVHIGQFFRTNDFCHLASGGIFSHEVGAKKPEPAMYEAFEKRYGRPAIYFDDKKENVEAAIARGWKAEVFSGAAALLSSVKACERPL